MTTDQNTTIHDRLGQSIQAFEEAEEARKAQEDHERQIAEGSAIKTIDEMDLTVTQLEALVSFAKNGCTPPATDETLREEITTISRERDSLQEVINQLQQQLQAVNFNNGNVIVLDDTRKLTPQQKVALVAFIDGLPIFSGNGKLIERKLDEIIAQLAPTPPPAGGNPPPTRQNPPVPPPPPSGDDTDQQAKKSRARKAWDSLIGKPAES